MINEIFIDIMIQICGQQSALAIVNQRWMSVRFLNLVGLSFPFEVLNDIDLKKKKLEHSFVSDKAK